jgi:L-ascorbate metabolism protein UlaG (beta-lactamase superfamily)
VVTYGGKRFYFSADTEGDSRDAGAEEYRRCLRLHEPALHDDTEEAAEAVRAFHPAIVYPYHYRSTDLTAFVKPLEGSGIEVRLRDWYAK